MYTKNKSYDGKVFLLDVTSDQFLEDPYRFYRERYNVSPVIQIEEMVWSVTSYEVMSKILSNPNTGRMGDRTMDSPELRAIREKNPILKILHDWMLFKNPPDHTRLRKLVSHAFTPGKIRKLAPIMRESMQNLLNNIKDSSGNVFDMVSTISYPFPVSIISAMMGIPDEDQLKFRKWSRDFAYALATEITTLPSDVKERLNQSAIDLTNYFEKLIDQKKEDLSDDLISTLIKAGDEEEKLSNAEILSNCTLLLVAGHETTTSLLSNGMNALLNHPDQFEILKSDFDLIPNAIEEFLRFDPPVQSIGRTVFEDIEINGYEFKKGSAISTILGAAGRDPQVNEDPEKFDITRKEINHLAFAKGIHYCLGASLARMEAKIAFEEILKEIPDLSRSGKAKRNKNWLLRGFAELPMQYT